MIVLRIGERERVGAKTLAQILEAERNHFATAAILAAFPQVSGVGHDTLDDHLVGNPYRAVKLERASLYDHGSRILPGPSLSVITLKWIPRRARLRARFRPVGPAPTINAGACFVVLFKVFLLLTEIITPYRRFRLVWSEHGVEGAPGFARSLALEAGHVSKAQCGKTLVAALRQSRGEWL
jgi:hypothetical protein